ncbi:hypothetical protein K9M59_03375 [Candidatus Gracilibacteria bacterium]|nr:hypothetical protein [Candidatus Gracilibacteria bacterium]MCF7819369.1 hypothetical protein [Candidatus Gracilibacteria bacterium]
MKKLFHFDSIPACRFPFFSQEQLHSSVEKAKQTLELDPAESQLDEMLDLLLERAEGRNTDKPEAFKGKYEELSKIVRLTSEDIKKDQQKVEQKLESLSAEKLAELANPKNLNFSEAGPEAKGNEMLYRFAGQMYRTAMFEYVLRYLRAANREDEAKTFEKLLATNPVKNPDTYGPRNALVSAKWLGEDVGLKSPSKRGEIEKRMTGASRPASEFLSLHGKKMKKFSTVVGGDMIDIGPEDHLLDNTLELKNWGEYEGKIYAQVSNGCQGNLVIIEYGKETVEPPKPEVPCIDCEIQDVSIGDVGVETYEQWLDVITDWEKRGIDRSKIAQEIYNYFLMDTPLGKISRRHGILGLVLPEKKGSDLIPDEYLGQYKSFLKLDKADKEKLVEIFTEENLEKQFNTLQAMHQEAVENNGVLSQEYKALLEEQLGRNLSEEEFRNFGEKLAGFTWETFKQSVAASLTTTAVASIAAGAFTPVGVVFIEAFRSTIGARTDLEMASLRKLDIVTAHAQLHKKDFIQEILKSGKGRKEHAADFRLYMALDRKITGEALKSGDEEIINQYLDRVVKDEVYAETLYQTAHTSKKTIEKNTDGSLENDEEIEVNESLRQTIEARRETYEKYRQEVGKQAFDAVKSRVEAQNIFSGLIRSIGSLLGRDGIDTPEEAYQSINDWILEYEQDSNDFEIRDGQLQFSTELLAKMKGLKENDPEDFDEEMKELDQRNRKYLTALQLRAQLFNQAKLSLPQEGSVIFSQAVDIMDRVQKGIEDEKGKKVMEKIKPSVDKYLQVTSQIYAALDSVMYEGSGFSLEEMELSGDAQLSNVLGKIRENVEALNRALAEKDTSALAEIVGRINRAADYNYGGEATAYESVDYLENVVLQELKNRRKPEVVQIPEWVQQNRKPEYKEESPNDLKICELAPEDYRVIPSTDESSGMPIGWAFEVARKEQIQTPDKTRTEVKEVVTGEEFQNKRWGEVMENFTYQKAQEMGLVDKYLNGQLQEYFSSLSVEQQKAFLDALNVANVDTFFNVLTKTIEKTIRIPGTTQTVERLGIKTLDALEQAAAQSGAILQNEIFSGGEKESGFEVAQQEKKEQKKDVSEEKEIRTEEKKEVQKDETGETETVDFYNENRDLEWAKKMEGKTWEQEGKIYTVRSATSKDMQLAVSKAGYKVEGREKYRFFEKKGDVYRAHIVFEIEGEKGKKEAKKEAEKSISAEDIELSSKQYDLKEKAGRAVWLEHLSQLREVAKTEAEKEIVDRETTRMHLLDFPHLYHTEEGKEKIEDSFSVPQEDATVQYTVQSDGSLAVEYKRDTRISHFEYSRAEIEPYLP